MSTYDLRSFTCHSSSPFSAHPFASSLLRQTPIDLSHSNVGSVLLDFKAGFHQLGLDQDVQPSSFLAPLALLRSTLVFVFPALPLVLLVAIA